MTLLLMMAASVGWSEEVSIILSEQGYENGQEVSSTTSTSGDVTLTYNKGTSSTAPAYYNTGTGVRVYAGGNLTVTASGNTITKVVVTYAKNNSPKVSGTPEGWKKTDSPATWEGSATEVVLNVKNSGHIRIQKVVVTYETSSTTPFIIANNVNIDYDATSGEIGYTITNPVTGTSLTADVPEGSWLTLGTVSETSIPFTCKANEGEERTATVTLTYGDITKDVTITQAAAPKVYTTIPELFTAATSTEQEVNVTFNNWVVSGISTNGKNVFVTDKEGHGFVIYSSEDQSSSYKVGDVLSGTSVSCNLKLFNGFAEILDLKATDLTITSGGSVSASNIALADLAGVNTGALVSYENLTCSIKENKYYLSDGTTTIQVYNSLYNFDTLEADKKYNITGIYQQYNNTKEIMPRSAADIVEVFVPSITAADVNLAYDANSGEIEYTINNPNGGVLTAIASADWITDVTVDAANSKVTFNCTANEGDTDRSATITLSYPDADDKEVTVTQAHQVVKATYELATSITPGKHYVIASGTSGKVKVMGNQNNNNRGAVEEEITDGVLEVSEAYDFLIEGSSTDESTVYYTFFDAEFPGYLYAASSSSNHLKTQKEYNANGTWAITIGNDGAASIVAQGSNSRNVMQYNSGSSLFACYASASQGPVYLFEKVESPVEITISSAGQATFSSTKTYAIPDGLTAYVVTAYSEENQNVTLTPLTSVIPANTGVVVKGEARSYTLTESSKSENIATNYLKANVTPYNLPAEEVIDGENYYNYTLAADGFKHSSGEGILAAGKAYLQIPYNVPATDAKLSLVFDGEGTGINNVNANDNANNKIFNLSGQRVGASFKGLVIKNGKKYINK